MVWFFDYGLKIMVIIILKKRSRLAEVTLMIVKIS